jgi:hypothetical protein
MALDYRVSPLSRRQIIQIARKIRNSWGLGTARFLPVLRILEALPQWLPDENS